MRKTTLNDKPSERRFVMRAEVTRSGAAALLFLIFSVSYSSRLQAEPNTGGNARSPKCEAEYQQCAKNCDKTQIDVGNQIQQCKNKCASDTDLYCSRALTSGGTTGTVPKASVGTLQNPPVNPPTKTPPPPARPQGVIINQLQAQPGFVFEASPTKNQVMARKAGGGLGASASCGCDSQGGTCTLLVTGGIAQCAKNPGDTCDGSCTFSTTQPSVSGGVMMRK